MIIQMFITASIYSSGPGLSLILPLNDTLFLKTALINTCIRAYMVSFHTTQCSSQITLIQWRTLVGPCTKAHQKCVQWGRGERNQFPRQEKLNRLSQPTNCISITIIHSLCCLDCSYQKSGGERMPL